MCLLLGSTCRQRLIPGCGLYLAAQALKDAAALAGLNVLALVNSHSAAALQFGIERDFAVKEQKVRGRCTAFSRCEQ